MEKKKVEFFEGYLLCSMCRRRASVYEKEDFGLCKECLEDIKRHTEEV